MAVLYITIGIVICVIGHEIFDYKKRKLEYEERDNEITMQGMKENINLNVEKERTKQHLIDKEKEAERTEQLRIKSEYREKHNAALY